MTGGGMRLCPREIDKLALRQAARVAQERLARGVRLNHPEATALIASVVRALAPPADGRAIAAPPGGGRIRHGGATLISGGARKRWCGVGKAATRASRATAVSAD